MFQQIHEAGDAGQGRADLVAHDGEELGFGLAGALRLDARLLSDLRCVDQLPRLAVALGHVAHDSGEALLTVDIAPFGYRQLQGTVAPSLRWPTTSRPMPMILRSPVSR